jgi:hypothetical protein
MGTTIGGSEIATLFGENKYKTYDELVTQKSKLILGEVEEFHNAPCSWGTLFEPVISMVVECDCGTYVHANGEDGISITRYNGHRTSPDGYCVMGFNYDAKGNLVVNTVDSYQPAEFYSIVLLEYKCPYGRWPNGKIPPQYVPQVLSGLAVSPIASFGVYVDAVFKCASFDSLLDIPALAYGVIGVYSEHDETRGKSSDTHHDETCGKSSDDQHDETRDTQHDETCDDKATRCEKILSSVNDLGKFTRQRFDERIIYIIEKHVKLNYSMPHMNPSIEEIEDELQEDLISMSTSGHLVAIIPWLLFICVMFHRNDAKISWRSCSQFWNNFILMLNSVLRRLDIIKYLTSAEKIYHFGELQALYHNMTILMNCFRVPLLKIPPIFVIHFSM